jgi:TM2 domain-containing membrane protein YozV
MAAVLSFFVPGLGHLYAGHIIQGLFFFVFVSACYAIAIVTIPFTAGLGFIAALLLHLFVIIDAQRAAKRSKTKEMAELATMLRK